MSKADILVGPVLGPFDATIISQPDVGTASIIQVLDVAKSFSDQFYFYLLICGCLTAAWLQFRYALDNKGIAKISISFWKHLITLIWKFYCLIIDQASVSSDSQYGIRIVWLTVTMALFVVIHGFMLNLISSDLIAQSSPPRIESINDLLTANFENVTIDIETESGAFWALRDARSGSAMNVIFNRLSRNSSSLLVGGYAKFTERLELLNAAKIVTISNSAAGNNRVMICCYKPIESTTLLESEIFFSSTLNTLFSKSVDTRLRSYIELQAMTIFESNVMSQTVRHFLISIFDLIGLDYNWNAIRCEKKLADISDHALPTLQVKTLSSSFVISYRTMFLAVFVLAVEMVQLCTNSSHNHNVKSFCCKNNARKVSKPKKAWI